MCLPVFPGNEKLEDRQLKGCLAQKCWWTDNFVLIFLHSGFAVLQRWGNGAGVSAWHFKATSWKTSDVGMHSPPRWWMYSLCSVLSAAKLSITVQQQSRESLFFVEKYWSQIVDVKSQSIVQLSVLWIWLRHIVPVRKLISSRAHLSKRVI